MNLSSAGGVANLKVAYLLTPFNQQGSARVWSSRAFPANSSTPARSVFTVHGGCPLGGSEVGLSMTLLSTTIHQHDWSVNASSHQIGVPTYTISSSSVSGVSLNGIKKKIRTGPRASLQLGRIQVQPERGQGETHPRAFADVIYNPGTCPVRRLMPLIALLTAIAKHVHIGELPHQADTVALDKQLEST